MTALAQLRQMMDTKILESENDRLREHLLADTLSRLFPAGTTIRRYDPSDKFSKVDYGAFQEDVCTHIFEFRCRDAYPAETKQDVEYKSSPQYLKDVGLNLRKYRSMLKQEQETGLPVYFIVAIRNGWIYGMRASAINPDVKLEAFRGIRTRENGRTGPNDDEALIPLYLPEYGKIPDGANVLRPLIPMSEVARQQFEASWPLR